MPDSLEQLEHVLLLTKFSMARQADTVDEYIESLFTLNEQLAASLNSQRLSIAVCEQIEQQLDETSDFIQSLEQEHGFINDYSQVEAQVSKAVQMIVSERTKFEVKQLESTLPSSLA